MNIKEDLAYTMLESLRANREGGAEFRYAQQHFERVLSEARKTLSEIEIRECYELANDTHRNEVASGIRAPFPRPPLARPGTHKVKAAGAKVWMDGKEMTIPDDADITYTIREDDPVADRLKGSPRKPEASDWFLKELKEL